MVNLPDTKIVDDIIRKVDKLPQMQCPVTNYFAPGVYVREMFIPAGTIAVGHKHLTEHVCTIVHGKIAFLRMDRSIDYYEAPATFIAGKGRKIVYAIEDTVVQNVHPNPDNIDDQTELEKIFIDKTGVYEEIEDRSESIEDIKDFQSLGYEDGKEKYIPLLNGFRTALSKNRSNIHGKGLFATWPFKIHEYICPWEIGGQLTEAARWINHAKRPNAYLNRIMPGETAVIAKRDINGCIGGGPGDEITIDYRSLMP